MSEGPRKTLLLVEDDILTALAEKKALEDYGYAVIAINSGERAVEAFRGGDPIDLILMDIDLGRGMDGTEAAEIIQRDHDLPIVFVSSHGEREVVEKTEKITSYGYVVKNSGITVLDASIKMAFKLFEANRRVKLANDKLVAIFDALPDLLFEVGLDGYYYNIHSSHPDLLYGPASELIGRRIPEVLPLDTAGILMSAIREAHEKGISTGKHYELEVPAGTRRFEISASRIEGHPELPRFIFLARDITDRRLMEHALRESEEKQRVMISSISDVIGIIGTDGIMKYKSPNIERWFGWKPEDLVGTDGWLTVHPDDLERVQKEFFALLAEPAGTRTVEYRYKCKDGSYKHIELTASNLVGDPLISGLLLNYHDIGERKLAEEVLRKSESLHRSILQTTMDGYCLTDSGGRILEVNAAYCEMSGYGREELLAMNVRDITIATEEEQVSKRIRRVISRGDERFDAQHRRKDGSARDVEVSLQYLPSEGDRIISFIRDITERKQAERRINNLLAEKELILKEVHHRIKNNMNTMIGLLSLHARKISDPDTAAVMKGAENHLNSMGHLYDKLYRSENYREVNARDYFPSLVEEIVGNFPNSSVARIEMDIDDFVIGAKALSTLGIFVNELVTNIMKYAFAGRAEGRILVSAKRGAAGATLTVRDDGVGLPESFRVGHSKGFGLMLIEALTKQLDGRLRIERERGTAFILDFEL